MNTSEWLDRAQNLAMDTFGLTSAWQLYVLLAAGVFLLMIVGPLVARSIFGSNWGGLAISVAILIPGAVALAAFFAGQDLLFARIEDPQLLRLATIGVPVGAGFLLGIPVAKLFMGLGWLKTVISVVLVYAALGFALFFAAPYLAQFGDQARDAAQEAAK